MNRLERSPLELVFGNISHPNSIRSTALALKKLHIPNYVYPRYHNEVVTLYRHLHRSVTRQSDPLCRHYLRQIVWESFAAHRYETSPTRIRYRIERGRENLDLFQQAAAGSIKATSTLMTLCFSQINIKQGPLKNILLSGGIGCRLNDTPPRQINALPKFPPKVITVDQYNEQYSKAKELFAQSTSTSTSSTSSNSIIENQNKNEIIQLPHLYFRFIFAIQKIPFLKLRHTETKITFEPLLEGTISGNPLPTVRVKNIIKSRIKSVLKFVRYPIDEDVLIYLINRLVEEEKEKEKGNNNNNSINYKISSNSKNKNLQIRLPENRNLRFYKRRILEFLEKSYTVKYDNLGNVIVLMPSVSRINVSKRSITNLQQQQ